VVEIKDRKDSERNFQGKWGLFCETPGLFDMKHLKKEISNLEVPSLEIKGLN